MVWMMTYYEVWSSRYKYKKQIITRLTFTVNMKKFRN